MTKLYSSSLTPYLFGYIGFVRVCSLVQDIYVTDIHVYCISHRIEVFLDANGKNICPWQQNITIS